VVIVKKEEGVAIAAPSSFLTKFYGFVDHIEESLTNTRLFNLSWEMMSSARSSGCITRSSLLLIKLELLAKSVKTVLGVKAVTRILCLRISCIRESVKPNSANFDAL